MAEEKETKMEAGRKLTAAEKRRLEEFQKASEELLRQGYMKKDLTTTALKANVLGLLCWSWYTS